MAGANSPSAALSRTKLEETFGKYGDVVPQKDGSFFVMLPHGSPLAEKLLPFSAAADGKSPMTATQEDFNDLGAATGGESTPGFNAFKNPKTGDVYLKFDEADVAKFPKYDLQRSLDGMLKYLRVAPRTTELDRSKSAQLASTGDLQPVNVTNRPEIAPQTPVIAATANSRVVT